MSGAIPRYWIQYKRQFTIDPRAKAAGERAPDVDCSAPTVRTIEYKN
jgi:hypothetical protein